MFFAHLAHKLFNRPLACAKELIEYNGRLRYPFKAALECLSRREQACVAPRQLGQGARDRGVTLDAPVTTSRLPHERKIKKGDST